MNSKMALARFPGRNHVLKYILEVSLSETDSEKQH